MNNKKIIITLIQDHILNMRLINGLNALGWYSLDYHLHLTDVIFNLIGINDEKEELLEMYLKWCTNASQTDVLKDPILLQDYASEIYHVLLTEGGKNE